MYQEILYQVSVTDGVARVTLNRAERRNPLGPSTLGEILHALAEAQRDNAVRVVVFTGAGAVFSAGGDLAKFAGHGAGEPAPAIPPRTFADLLTTLPRLGKPTIAMVNGHAMAGGLSLVVGCDLAIASEEAQFALPEINVGLWPMMISAAVLRNVGRKAALHLMLTGERISASEAVRIGLVTRAVPKTTLAAEVDALAAKLTSKSPKIMELGLTALADTRDMSYDDAIRRLEKGLAEVLATEDAREGLTAFLEKRAPSWRGR